jgi:hypothetical protein
MSVRELVLARAVEKPGQEKDRREPPLPSKQEANAIVRARKTPQRVEAERQEQFDQAWRHVVTACKLSLKIDVPDLSDDQRNRLGVELRQAARNVGKFRLKIEAPAARTKETPA